MLKWLCLICLLSLMSGCQLPPNSNLKEQQFQITEHEWFFQDTESKDNINAGLTAHLSLQDPFMGMAARIHLIHQAEQQLDLQYYIWENDVIGQYILVELLKAAERGVKIRLLIDDQNGTQLDDLLIRLVQHPNIQIRIFNPYKYRKFRVLDYLFRFKKINQRMHNKLMIADGSIAITGGRNISSEYFDASQNFQFIDMDVLFYGPSVQQANTSFLAFWNDQLSYPIHQLLKHDNKNQSDSQPHKTSRQNFEEILNYFENAKKQYAEQHELNYGAIEFKIEDAEKKIKSNLNQQPIQWSKAYFVADLPTKIYQKVQQDISVASQMHQMMGTPKQHLELVSSYFVPTTKGADYLNQLVKNGVKVRVLTNSFLANDVPIVHAFYQKYRKTLLQNGVKLYEFKPYIQRGKRTWYERMSGNVIPSKNKNASRLHAKFFDVDGSVFIGSFNFDPRSINLNTEVGLVVESAILQNEISDSLDQYLPHIAYELQLDQNQNIIWLEQQKNGTTKTYHVEPETTRFQRVMIKLISFLPIEWMM